MKTILVTGGAGFIGSNFIKYVLENYSNFLIINVDLLTYAGNELNLVDIQQDKNYKFIKADIRDFASMERIFSEYAVDYVINFAAESHVDRSIDEPGIFLSTNVMGTHTLLEAARLNWKTDSGDPYSVEYRKEVRFYQISTDEVYGSLGKTGLFSEESDIAPNSPYSASKASADLFVRAYYETYKLPVVISRCSNNYGPRQHMEKFIPTVISRILKNQDIPVYGDGLQVRDWIYVEDHCRAILDVLLKGRNGEVYNIGGDNEQYNIDIVKTIIQKLGHGENLIKNVRDRLGHDRRYAIDNTKIKNELGWKPQVTFNKGIEITVEWYVNNLNKKR